MFKKFFIGMVIVASTITAFLFLKTMTGSKDLYKPFLSALFLAGFGLTGLCCSTIYNQPKLRWFSVVGIGVTFLGIIISLQVIWTESASALWRIPFSLVLSAGALAHISLLLLIKPKDNVVKNTLYITIAFIGITLLVILHSLLTNTVLTDALWFITVVFCAFLGSLILPFLNISSSNTSTTTENVNDMPPLPSQGKPKKNQRRGL